MRRSKEKEQTNSDIEECVLRRGQKRREEKRIRVKRTERREQKRYIGREA